MRHVDFEFRMIHPEARPPFRKRDTDAGYDLSSVIEIEIPSGGFASIPVGLQISAPYGYYYVMKSRSSMLMNGIVVSEAIIDATYTGDIFAFIHNHSKSQHKINVGDRIAQIVPYEIIHLNFVQKDQFSPSYDVRGTAGFGSSGK